MTLTDPSFIRRLDTLYLLARKILGGSLQSDRRSTKKGAGITFADYAQYTLGDDYRSIDWRIYAKFESLLIKLFEQEVPEIYDGTVMIRGAVPGSKGGFVTVRAAIKAKPAAAAKGAN